MDHAERDLPSGTLNKMGVPDRARIHCPGCDLAADAFSVRALRYDQSCPRCLRHRVSEFRPKPKQEGGA